MCTTMEAVRGAIRAFVPRPSQLRRSSDRIEVVARWVLLVVGLVLVPVALAVGSTVTANLVPQVAAEQAERHQVTAQVLAAPDIAPRSPSEVSVLGWAPVRWTAADGASRVATLSVPAAARAGDATRLWVDRQDRPTVAPRAAYVPAVEGFFTSASVLLGGLVVSVALLAALRRVLDRRRLREWEAAWRRFSPPGRENAR